VLLCRAACTPGEQAQRQLPAHLLTQVIHELTAIPPSPLALR
jgi:hypothetical protein